MPAKIDRNAALVNVCGIDKLHLFSLQSGILDFVYDEWRARTKCTEQSGIFIVSFYELKRPLNTSPRRTQCVNHDARPRIHGVFVWIRSLTNGN